MNTTYIVLARRKLPNPITFDGDIIRVPLTIPTNLAKAFSDTTEIVIITFKKRRKQRTFEWQWFYDSMENKN